MRSTIARRLELLLASFEKRHGRMRRVKLPEGRLTEYKIKDPPRIKKICPWDVADYFTTT